MTNDGSGAADVLVALSDATRRAILERLEDGEVAAGEIARGLPVSRPAVSQHLRVLERAGLVRHRRDGTRRYYRIEGAGLLALQRYLERFWGIALAAYRDEARRRVREKPGENDERDHDPDRPRRD